MSIKTEDSKVMGDAPWRGDVTTKARSIVISQPMLMPWRGMFEQIRLSDSFVFYDDVQLPLGGGKGRGFITRVQIKSADGFRWLSLPVRRSSQGRQFIAEAVFAHQDWRNQHLASISQCYRSAPFFEQTFDAVVRPIYSFETESIAEFCMNSMIVLAEALCIKADWHVASHIERPDRVDASERVLELCRHFSAAHYITGLGAMNYINYELFEAAGVSIDYMQYRLTPYPQIHGAFNPYVSVIDLLFNVGPDAARYLDSPAVYWKKFLASAKESSQAS